ncbi:hypothetical protein B1A_12904 [mine drainage metagenome]|uniref:DUF2089 domain-containing protein n=1 Tax=mine drainage metagenome TaxID=410659 RepID=T1A4M7_9ZZZZ
MAVTRLRCPRCETEVHGSFLAPLAQLSVAQQAFAVRFLVSRGNLKELEREEGVSYQALRSLLDEIVAQLTPASASRADVLTRLRRGDLRAEAALRLLEAADQDEQGGNEDG